MEETGGGAQCTAECVEERLHTTLQSSGKILMLLFSFTLMAFLKTTPVLKGKVAQ